jgi:hypothetical protein
VPPDLGREIEAWIAGNADRDNPRAFLFPNSSGTAFGVGNYLKRHLKPLAEKVGIVGLTHQAFRRTSSTHMQNHASVKDMQRHLRHTDPQTTLKHYAKAIPEPPSGCCRPGRTDHRHSGDGEVSGALEFVDSKIRQSIFRRVSNERRFGTTSIIKLLGHPRGDPRGCPHTGKPGSRLPIQ